MNSSGGRPVLNNLHNLLLCRLDKPNFTDTASLLQVHPSEAQIENLPHRRA
jgi:hypothetical protein